MPSSAPLSYILYKPDGSKVSSGQLQPEETGFYTFSHETSDNSQTGKYHYSLTYADSNTASYYFKVEDFLPERLDLVLFDGKTEEKRLIQKPDQIDVPVISKYLYGAPASGNKVDGFVVAGIDEHPFDHLKTFYFGDKNTKNIVKRFQFPEIKLSETGTGTLISPNKWRDIKSPVRLNISASVYETGGRPVTRSSRVTLLNSTHLIGLEPQFKDSPDSNSTVDFKVGYADVKGNWTKKQLEVKLIRQDRNWFWRHSNSRGWHWAWNETPVVVFSKTVSVKKNETSLISLPLSWGNYLVEATDGDVVSSYEFKTSWSWWGNAGSESSQKPDMVSLGFDHNTYEPGDVAQLRINPPQDGLALVTIESSDAVLFTKYMPVESSGTVVDIQTEDTWDRHDLYASVMVIRPGDMIDTPVPTRAFGMVHLPVKRNNTKLNVEISAPDKVEPNQNVQAKVKLSADYPLSDNIKVVVALVDVGVLNITRFKTPDAESYFFGPRRYSLDLYDNYGQVIDNLGQKDAMQRFGGGFNESDDDLARGGNKPKSEVLIVSFFSDPLSPDENGEVNVNFTLPNFNGQLRWMALAFADEQYGNADADMTVADKVVTQLAMPRFLALGDTSTIALDVQNMSDVTQSLIIDMNIEGSLKALSEQQTIELKDQEKTTLRFPLSVIASSGQGIITAQITNESQDIKVNRTWKLGVRSPYPAVTRRQFAVISKDSEWSPDLKIDDLIDSTIQFQMNLSNKPPIDFAGHFKYLLHYPYGCLEQSTSSSYPWILSTPEILGNMGLIKQVENQFGQDFNDDFRIKQANAGVLRVLDKQKSNGSFGLWSSDSPEEKWLSVYAAEFLNDAKKMGASVSVDALNKANAQLRKYLVGNYTSTNNRYSEDMDHYEFAFRSYAGYVLGKANIVNLSDLRRLQSKFSEKTDDDGLSWMYMAAAFKMAGDAKNSDACYTKAMAERKRVRHRYYGEYGSSVRDLARIAELSMKHDFINTSNLIYDLSNAVKDRRWLSTQERICLFRTAIVIQEEGGDTYAATLKTDNGDQELSRKTAFNTLFDLPMYKSLKSIKAGDDTIYANISMVGERINSPKPESNDISIKRRFYDINGNSITLDQIKSGELAVVQLEINSKNRTPDGLVIDLIPAGLEIENQNLGLASVNLDEIVLDGKSIGDMKHREFVKHEEFRDDRYVAAIDIYGGRTVQLFYLVRAVTPGFYKMPSSYVEDMYRPYRFGISETLEQTEVFE